MMNALSLLVALAAIVFFWWPFGTFVFERLTQGRQPPTPWTARPIDGRGTSAEGSWPSSPRGPLASRRITSL